MHHTVIVDLPSHHFAGIEGLLRHLVFHEFNLVVLASL